LNRTHQDKTVTPWLSTIPILLIVAMLCLQSGCAATQARDGVDSIQAGIPPANGSPNTDTVTIFFFRQPNYMGGGRIHMLRLDGHAIGELTGDNYYRLELWPGEYQFTVFLPSEIFFGQTNPPMSISDRVFLEPGDAGAAFTYQFTDGMGDRGFQRRRVTVRPTALAGRSMAARLTARDTAQVTSWLNARYDGPAIHGRPHGRGTLTWPDGGVYKGIFEHGCPTGKARFYFPNGQVFMGVFAKGRPESPGILMAPDGHILFAGRFVDEKPNGVGLRTGTTGPEFCIFDHGRDTTKSFRQLAAETMDPSVDTPRIIRWLRELAKAKELKKDHQAAIQRERTWCREEFDLGRNLCGCAPLAPDFDNWQECAAPVGERHYLP
jgi:hypothetical protein